MIYHGYLSHYHDCDLSCVSTNSLSGTDSVDRQSPRQRNSKATGSSCSAVDLQYLPTPSLILSVLTACGHGSTALFIQTPGLTVNRAGAVEPNANMPTATKYINITDAIEKMARIGQLAHNPQKSEVSQYP